MYIYSSVNRYGNSIINFSLILITNKTEGGDTMYGYGVNACAPVAHAGVGVSVIAVAILILIALGLVFSC